MDANDTPTRFTDDSLKFMQESFRSGVGFTLGPAEGKAFLNRLEAAETFVNLAADYSESVHPLVADAFRNWRKAAGKRE